MKQWLITALFMLAGSTVIAQTNSVSGVVRTTDEEGSRAIAGASVIFTDVDGKARGAYTDAQGRFTVKALPTGTYNVRVTCVGYSPFEQLKYEVLASQTDVEFALEVQIVEKDATVVTASRIKQKSSEAPASITVVEQRKIAERPAQTPIEHLQGEAGIDMAATSIAARQTTVRGFNNVFSGNLMVLTDYRLASIPSLRANVSYYVPTLDQDIERIELVRGPGSALYGPNAALGVMNIISLSPFESKGTTVFMTGGVRSSTDIIGDNGTYYSHVGFRHAGTAGERFGYKVSAQYQNAWDWAFDDTEEIVPRDNLMRRYTADARIDYLIGDDATLSLSGGVASSINVVEMTDIGAAQGRNWILYNTNLRLTWKDLFAQVFFNGNNSGETFNLRTGADLVDRSTLLGVRLQHASHVGDWLRLTYGGDFFLTNPVTDSTINGRNEDDDTYNEIGGYVQADVVLIKDKLHLLAAGRVDKHSVLADPVFSPRAALLFNVTPSQTLRATFNQAFTTPSSVDLFLDLLAGRDVFNLTLINENWGTDLWASSGAKSGYTFNRQDGRPLFVSQYNKSTQTSLDSASSNGVWEGQTQALLAALSLSPDIDSATFAFLQQFLGSIESPQDINGNMALLNATTQQFSPVADVANIPTLKPTITTTFEVGYQGFLFDKLRINVDAYYSQVTDFISGLQIVTPNVFFDGGETKDYLKPRMKAALEAAGLSEPEAEAQAEALSSLLGDVYSQIPVGTVSPNETPHNGDILLAARNFGEIDYYGVDFSFQYVPVIWLEIGGAFSYMSNNYWTKEEIGGVQDFSFNAPQYKGSLNATYRNQPTGLSVGAQWRWVDGFNMISGVFEGPVEAYNLIDFRARMPFPGYERLTATLAITNLLDHQVQQFVGAPAIGRLTTLRLQYTF